MTKHSTNPRRASGQAGFTLVEIVIAFIIVGILTAILVPTIARRSEDAKIAAAQQDLEHLATAEERVTIDLGYLIRIYALNDVRGGDGTPNSFPGSRINGLNDNGIGGDPYTTGNQLFISPATQDFLPIATQQSLFNRLTAAETDLQLEWKGPYINWQKDVNHNDWPDDPWGNDYLFFTRLGVIYPPDPNSTSAGGTGDHSFAFQTSGANGQPVANHFDRPTFISLGPNGVPGDATNPNYGFGDDIVRSFGGQ